MGLAHRWDFLCVRNASLMLVLWGIFGFLGGIILGDMNEAIPDGIELPLRGMRGFEVDDAGRVYCALQSYGRIQVYDADGEFVRGVAVKDRGGDFRIRTRGDEGIEVAFSRRDGYAIIDSSFTVSYFVGDGGSYYRRFRSPGNTIGRVRNGVRYRYLSSLGFYPRIVRADEMMIRMPIYFLAVPGVLQGWCLFAAGIGLGYFDSGLRRKRS